MKDIYYFPRDDGNPYVRRNQKILADNPEFNLIPSGLKQLLYIKKGVVILNWIEYISIKNNKKSVSLTGLAKLFFLYISLLKSNAHIVYIFHDRKPHNATRAGCFFFHLSTAILKKISCIRLAHSPVEGYPYLPCPLLVEDENVRIDISKSGNILFLGRLQKYKKIIETLDVFERTKCTLHVMGKSDSKEFHESLISAVENFKNVILEDRYIPDSEINNIITHYSAIFIPHDDESAIVSGNIALALSFNLPIIAKSTAYLKYLNTKIFGIYLYNSTEELISTLQEFKDTFPLIDYKRRRDQILAEFSNKVILNSYIEAFTKCKDIQ